MAKKIKYTDLAEEKLFQPAIDSASELIKVLNQLEKQFKELLKESKELSKQEPLKGYENIKRTEEAINNTKKAVQGLDKIEAERAKLQQKIKDLEEGRLNTSIRLREEIRVRTRNIRQEASATNEIATVYEKQSARLVLLRKRYKDLAAQNRENEKGSKALLREITKLDNRLKEIDDSVGQNVRSVGNYKIATDKLRGSFKLLAGSAVVATLTQIVQLFNNNSEGAASLQKALGRITVTLSVLVNRFVKAIPLIENLFDSLITRVSNGFNVLILQVELLAAKLPDLLGGSAEKAKELTEQIQKLEAESASQTKALLNLTDAFSGVSDEISSLIDTNDALIDRTLIYQKQINALNKQTEQLRSQQRLLQVASDDNTTSLESQTQATIELINANEAISQKEIEVAAKRFELAQLNAKVNKASIQAQTELAEAFIALEAAKGEASEQRINAEKTLRDIEAESRNLDLDQLIDIADRRKTINEQIAADERNNLEARQEAITKAREDTNKSFIKQNERLQKGLEQSFDIDALINEEDTVKLNERIKLLELDSDRENRLRDILNERLQAIQDLDTAQSDLNDSSKEGAEIQSDIILQEAALQQLQESRISTERIFEELNERRTQNEIDNLRIRIKLATEGSTELLDLNQQLNDKLLEQNKARIEKEQEQQQEFTKLSFDLIQRLSEKRSQARIDAIDKEIAATERRTESLRALAEQGVENADENIATEQKKQAELEQQREQAVKRQARQQLFLASIETYNAKIQAGEPNPLAATVAEIATLEAFINSLPAFYEGSEMIGDDLNPTLSGKDGYVVRVDGSERVLTGQQNAMIGQNMSNMELATLAYNSRNKKGVDSDIVANKIDKLTSIIDSKPVYLGKDYDATRKAIIDVVAKKNRIERNSRKGNSIF